MGEGGESVGEGGEGVGEGGGGVGEGGEGVGVKKILTVYINEEIGEGRQWVNHNDQKLTM